MGKFNRDASTNLVYIISDCIVGVLTYILVILIWGDGKKVLDPDHLMVCVAFLMIFVLANKESRMYNVTTFFYVDRMIKRVTKSFLISTGVLSTLLFYVGDANIETIFYVAYLLFSYVMLLGNAFFVRFVLMKYFAHAPRTIIIGNRERFEKFERFVKKSNLEMQMVGYVCIDEADYNQEEYIGTLDALEELIHEYGVDQVYIMQRRSNQIDIQPYLNMCMEMGVTVRIIMNAFRAGAAQTYVSSVGTYPILTYHTVSLNASERFTKRLIDIFGSLFGIIVFFPIMVCAAIAVKLDSKGPVIFKQKRVGMNGRQFSMFKFRSMCMGAEIGRAHV